MKERLRPIETEPAMRQIQDTPDDALTAAEQAHMLAGQAGERKYQELRDAIYAAFAQRIAAAPNDKTRKQLIIERQLRIDALNQIHRRFTELLQQEGDKF